MKSFDIPSLFAVAALALLTACGGSVAPDDGHVTNAALMEQGNAPVADCEAEGCNRPRIIDGLAEQFRAGAIEQPQAQPSEPVQPGAVQPAGLPAQPQAAAAPDQPVSAAAPAVAGQPQ